MALMNMHQIVLPLLLLAVTFVVLGLATSWWPCGNLFTQCGKPLVMLVILILYIGGAFFLALVFIIDAFGLCGDSVVPGPLCATLKMFALLLGSASIVVSTLIHTWSFISWWSYYFVVVGSVFSLQAVVIGLLGCRCLKS